MWTTGLKATVSHNGKSLSRTFKGTFAKLEAEAFVEKNLGYLKAANIEGSSSIIEVPVKVIGKAAVGIGRGKVDA